MSLLENIHSRIRREVFSRHYRWRVGKVLDTPPLVQGSEAFCLLSMVHTRDVLSYLVAVKSFARYTNPRRIVVVCDPSITAEDRTVLTRHIPFIELRNAQDFLDQRIPRGGCWERLHAISTISPDDYVIQLDADTVTLADPLVVKRAIASQSGFVLGEQPGQTALTLESAAARWTNVSADAHIQVLSEAALPTLGLNPQRQYVRGCAGFTGFPASTSMRDELLDFSDRMRDRLKDKWTRWGTEQVTSNYLAANTAGFSVLPFPQYCSPDHRAADTLFLHYIGYLRFINFSYARDSEAFIRSCSNL